ncbi:MAG: tetratricopeptide repeat protein [Candidatus Gastranaerophilales bacterium]|nr:tetratricopeptide repeat protein [Candidatus Gastranaerophilales bacterium]
MVVNFLYRDLAYTIFSRFEETMRLFVENKLKILYSDFKEGIPEEIIKFAQNRKLELDINNCKDLLQETDFTHLKDIVLFKKSYKKFFEHTDIEQQKFMDIYEDLRELRCKISHTKPFSVINLEKLIELIEILIPELAPYNKELEKYLEDIKTSPEKVARISVPVGYSENDYDDIPNNLPVADYEYEGGFVGRKSDIDKVKDLLLGNIHKVITITGAGGVGKTSLAIRVLDEIRIKNKNAFDYIVWLSAKDKRLSPFGIEEINPTLKDYEQLLDEILEVTDFEKETKNKTVEQKEDDVRIILETASSGILIVIDNLETISDERITNFIYDCPNKAKFLITSRKGLREVNRIHDLRELSEDEAVRLFRIISKDKNLQSLVKLKDDLIKNYVKKVSCYPLAIKWLIGQAAQGKPIAKIINSISDDTSDITKFCFEQVYNELSPNAQKTLCTICCFDEPPSDSILCYSSELNNDNFEDAITELVMVSLVIPSQEDNGDNIITKYDVLSLTRGFVNNILDKNKSLRRKVQERIRDLKLVNEEAVKSKNQLVYDFFDMSAITDEEKVATIHIRNAKKNYKLGLYEKAKELYKTARKIAPEYPAVYIEWSIMESQERHFHEAEKLIQEAVKLNPEDYRGWFVWGNINLKNDNIDSALEKYEKASSLKNNDMFIINQLGYSKCRQGKHEEADKLYNKALNIAISIKSKKHEIMSRTSLADNLRRWSEYKIADKDYDMAQEKLFMALNHAKKAQKMDKTDPRNQILLSKINLELAYLYKKIGNPEAIKYFKDAIIKNPIKDKAKNYTIRAIKEIVNYLQKNNNLDEIDKYVPYELFDLIKQDVRLGETISNLEEKIKNKPKTLFGKIIRYNIKKMYFIIANENEYEDTYLGFFNDFNELDRSKIRSLLGRKVTFTPTEQDEYKNAKDISLIT